tara:strand:- start:2193 stop:2660 length:468 start_codon:yes stop_codon:yes gene_type:complete
MAATSTNKQPLLIDRVLHNVVNLDLAAVGAIDVLGTNTAALIVDATSSDGCLIEDVYCISRSTAPQKINLYMSSSFDYLRPQEGVFIGQLTSAATIGAVVSLDTLPKILAPMPQTGTETQFRALYIPKGRALWAGREDVAAVNDGPLLGVQGGWY